MTEETKISVRSLCKIFGRNPQSMIARVRDGTGKQELLEQYGHVLGLRDINLDIPAGGIFVVMGLSGSGKSTLIRHFNRIIEPTAGSITIDGRNIMALDDVALRDVRRNEISMVFQRFGLFPHRTIIDNIAYGLTVQGIEESEARKRAFDWLERVGLSGCEGQYPAQLSGGMQQRVGLARALATDADILLMDEAFSALDPLIRSDMQDMLLGLQSELNRTIIFITHDLEEALKLGDRVAILRDGDLVQDGDVQSIVLDPADAYVEDFVRGINRGRVIEVASIMEPLNGKRPALELDEATVLEDALILFTREKAQSARVVGPAGDAVGYVKLDDVVSAMAMPA